MFRAIIPWDATPDISGKDAEIFLNRMVETSIKADSPTQEQIDESKRIIANYNEIKWGGDYV